jgi:hypothetical protein
MKEEARGRGSDGRRVGNQLLLVEGRGSDVRRVKGGWRGSEGQKEDKKEEREEEKI